MLLLSTGVVWEGLFMGSNRVQWLVSAGLHWCCMRNRCYCTHGSWRYCFACVVGVCLMCYNVIYMVQLDLMSLGHCELWVSTPFEGCHGRVTGSYLCVSVGVLWLIFRWSRRAKSWIQLPSKNCHILVNLRNSKKIRISRESCLNSFPMVSITLWLERC